MQWKIPEFDDARFDESAPWNPDAGLDLDALAQLVGTMVNPARVSKVGTGATAVCEEVVLDVLVDLEPAFPGAVRALGGRDEETLRGRVAELTCALVDRQTSTAMR